MLQCANVFCVQGYNFPGYWWHRIAVLVIRPLDISLFFVIMMNCVKSTRSGFFQPGGRKRSQVQDDTGDRRLPCRKKTKKEFAFAERRVSKRIESRRLEKISGNFIPDSKMSRSNAKQPGTHSVLRKSGCFNDDIRDKGGHRSAFDRRKKILDRENLRLTFSCVDRMKYGESIRGVQSLHISNNQHGLKDTYSTSFIEVKEHYTRERRNQEIYQKCQDLLEELPPQISHSENIFKAVVKGRVIRELETTRCDGWCYSWIYDWFFNKSFIPYIMLASLEVKSSNSTIILRHYFILVPSQASIKVKDCLKSENKNILYVSGERFCLKVVKDNDFFIYDPTFCNLSLFNPDNIYKMAKDYCDVDGYIIESFLVQKVSFFQKDFKPIEFEESDVTFLARRILMTSVSWFFDGDYQYDLVYKKESGVIKQLKFAPSDVCPDELREGAEFYISTLYCLATILPGSHLSVDRNRPNKLDVLHCYRSDHLFFTSTLKEALTELLHQGFTPEACIAALSADHGGINALNNKELIPIPEQIYSKFYHELKNQYDWKKLGDRLFVELNIDTRKESASFSDVLNILLGKFKSPNDFVTKLQKYIDCGGGNESREFRRSLVFDREELRHDLKAIIARGDKMYTPYCLLKHCIRQCWQEGNQEYIEIIKLCKPIHTLAVCCTKSESYQSALIEYFQDANDRRLSFKDMAEELNRNQGRNCSIHIVPPSITRRCKKRGSDSWSEHLTQQIMGSYISGGKVVPRKEPSENRLKSLIDKLGEHCHGSQPLLAMSSALFSKNNIIDVIITVHPELSRSQINNNKVSCLRYLLESYKSPVLSDERVRRNKENVHFKIYLHPYDKVMILEPHSEEWNKSLVTFIEHLLGAGFNLTKISHFFRQGTINHNKYSIPVPGGSDCNWTFIDLIEFLEKQGKNATYLRTNFNGNKALDLELKLYEKECDVEEYHGLLFYYMNCSIKDESRRTNELYKVVNRNSITIPQEAEDCSSKIQYYRLLLKRLC